MATLTFPGIAVLELLAHAKAAPEHSAGYLSDPRPGPGLLFVKDSGGRSHNFVVLSAPVATSFFDRLRWLVAIGVDSLIAGFAVTP